MTRRSIFAPTALLAAFLSLLTVVPQALGQLVREEVPLSSDSVDIPALGERQLNRWQRDTTIALNGEGHVTLAPVTYLIDDVGNYINWLGVDGKTQARKRFMLDRAGFTGAQVYVYMGRGEANINGHALTFEPIAHGMGGWSQATVPLEWLRKGENVITFTKGFRFGYDKDRGKAKFSSVSADGGETWTAAPGELLVHVRVHGYPTEGTLTSPVFDFGNPYEHKYTSPEIRRVAYHVLYDAIAPEGTAIVVETRGGDTPILTGAWKPIVEGFTAQETGKFSVDGGAIAHTPRFVQIRLKLTSTRMDATPVIASALIRGDAAIASDPNRDALRVTAMDNNDPLIVPSQVFTFQGPSANLKQLREQFKLDEVVAEGETEMEKFILLRNWVRRQWPHNDDGAKARTWNAIEILSAPAGQKGMCVHYGVTYTQCAVALGYHARNVILNGHYVSEIWSNEHQKWVLMDVETTNSEGWSRYGTAMYIDDRTGIPMSGKDLFEAVHSGDVSYVTQEMYMTAEPPAGEKSTKPIGDHIKYQRKYDVAGLKSYGHLGYPDRNNHLDQLHPWEESHGFDHYHSNAYLWWSNTPKNHTAEYSEYTTRPGDLDWTVNRTHVRLGATSQGPQVVRATMETFTPNVASLKYRINGKGDWQTLKLDGEGPHQVTEMQWKLDAGLNQLEVKPVTVFGTEGVVTRVEIERK